MERVYFKPKWAEPCLCGSGKKHKDCCWQRRPGFDIGNDYIQAIKAQNYEKALVAARADIVQYTIWHKTNTEPALSSGKPMPVQYLLKIDVDALADYVERLLWLYFRLERSSELSDVLARLRNNIQHPKWRRKIAYFRALVNLGPGGDREKARAEFAKAGAISVDEGDVELLQLYVELEIDKEPFSMRIKYIDSILSLDDTRINQMQYRGLKAIQYFMIGDRSAAKSECNEAIEVATTSEVSEPLSFSERLQLARLTALSSSLTGDLEQGRLAIGHFHSLLLEDKATKVGRGSIFCEIGNCHKYARDWTNAINAYRDALAADHNPLYQIHLAECLTQMDQIDEAIREIDDIDRTKLDNNECYDFVFAFATIAIWRADEARLREARGLLERLNTPEPYFNDRRLSLLVTIADTLASGTASEKAKADSAPNENPLSVASDIFILKPTFMGIGININAAVEYFLKRKHKGKHNTGQ